MLTVWYALQIMFSKRTLKNKLYKLNGQNLNIIIWIDIYHFYNFTKYNYVFESLEKVADTNIYLKHNYMPCHVWISASIIYSNSKFRLDLKYFTLFTPQPNTKRKLSFYIVASQPNIECFERLPMLQCIVGILFSHPPAAMHC